MTDYPNPYTPQIEQLESELQRLNAEFHAAMTASQPSALAALPSLLDSVKEVIARQNDTALKQQVLDDFAALSQRSAVCERATVDLVRLAADCRALLQSINAAQNRIGIERLDLVKRSNAERERLAALDVPGEAMTAVYDHYHNGVER
jgi:hypothetical protein